MQLIIHTDGHILNDKIVKNPTFIPSTGDYITIEGVLAKVLEVLYIYGEQEKVEIWTGY